MVDEVENGADAQNRHRAKNGIGRRSAKARCKSHEHALLQAAADTQQAYGADRRRNDEAKNQAAIKNPYFLEQFILRI